MSNPNDIWQVDVNGTVYEAAFSELPEWIDGGSLLPEDKVRKGNLRWIEAQRVPTLVPFFNAKKQGLPMPVVVTTTDAGVVPADATPVLDGAFNPELPSAATAAEPPVSALAHEAAPTPQEGWVPPDPSRCANHREADSTFICDGCGFGLCRDCVKAFGGSVRLCSLCGALCRSLQEVAQTQKQKSMQYASANESFGFGDFAAALRFPFNFKTSLFFGALLFTLFSIGQSAASIGGIFMVAAALMCVMLANMLTFGVLSNTVNNFVQGNLDENFMPGFDDFSIWDDVLHPFFLSIGAYLVSFGPFIITVAVGFYLVISAVTSQIDSYKQDLERIPGTQVYSGRQLAEQSGDVKNVLSDISNKQAERIEGLTSQAETGVAPAANAAPTPFVDVESKQQEELWAMAQDMRRQQLEGVVGKTAETRQKEQAAMFNAFLNLAAPLVVIGAVTFLWGLFFFPAACAVAAYTRSFVAAINPLVGLDTIRRLGFNYVKILFMGVLLIILSGIISLTLGTLLSVFDLPGLGNLPAKAVGGVVTFYVWVVFSCIIGYALFKSGDKLKLLR